MWDDGRTDFRKKPDRTAVFIRTTVHRHRLPVFHVILSKPEAQSKDPVGTAHTQCVQGAFRIVITRRPLGVVPAMHEIPLQGGPWPRTFRARCGKNTLSGECCRAQRIFQYNACGGKHTTKNGGPKGRVWDDGRTDFRKRPDRTAVRQIPARIPHPSLPLPFRGAMAKPPVLCGAPGRRL